MKLKQNSEFRDLFKKHLAIGNTWLFITIEEYANEKVLKTKPNEYKLINYQNAILHFKDEIEEEYQKKLFKQIDSAMERLRIIQGETDND